MDFKTLLYPAILTRNRPEIQLWCPRPKLNMDDFSILSCPQVYVEATREKEWNSLHALKGIGKEGKTVTLSITYTQQSFLLFLLIISIAQLGQRQTQGQKVSASIPGHGIVLVLHIFIFSINSNTTSQKALPHYVFVTCGIRCNDNCRSQLSHKDLRSFASKKLALCT